MSAKNISSILKKKGSEVHSVSPDATAYEAIAKMAETGTGSVLVIDRGEILGIFSAKDYGSRVVLQGKNGQVVATRDVMTHPVLTIEPDVKITEGMQIMSVNGIRHLPVMKDSQLLGIVTLADLVKDVLADQEFKIEQLMHYVGS